MDQARQSRTTEDELNDQLADLFLLTTQGPDELQVELKAALLSYYDDLACWKSCGYTVPDAEQIVSVDRLLYMYMDRSTVKITGSIDANLTCMPAGRSEITSTLKREANRKTSHLHWQKVKKRAMKFGVWLPATKHFSFLCQQLRRQTHHDSDRPTYPAWSNHIWTCRQVGRKLRSICAKLFKLFSMRRRFISHFVIF